MNWKSIVADFNTLQVKHKQLNSFGVGDIKQLIYLTQNKDKQENVDNNAPYYPLMYVLPGSVSQDEQYTTYNFNILICDIMNVKNYDIQNELLSDTLEICQDILAQFKYSVNDLQGNYYTDKYDITLPTNISPFTEAYEDILVGWNLPISIQVQTPLNRCIAPFNYWDITPSPTPTNTTTPTPTPSITPSITPTITPTSTTPPICGEQITISNPTNPEFDGTYNRVYSWTGGTFVGGWYSVGSPLGDGLWHSGVNPSGDLYSTYVRNVGTTAYTITDFYIPSTSTDRYFSLFKSEGSLIDNQIITYYSGLVGFTGSTNIGGVLYLTPGQSNSLFNYPMYVSYPSICPTTTPTNTATPTPTSTP